MKQRILYIIALLICSYSSYAQQVDVNPFLTDARGTPVVSRKSIVSEGSPYLSEQFVTADITSAGRTYINVRARINIVDGQIEYLTDDGKEMIATILITRVHFPAFPEENGKFISLTLESTGKPLNQKDAEVFAVLDSGKVSLLKKISIIFRDDKKYGEAVTTRHYLRSETNYVLLPNGELKKFEKGKSFILEVFQDQKEKVEQFIASKNIKCKSTADFRQVLQFYNSI
jgi:hypothetical protein